MPKPQKLFPYPDDQKLDKDLKQLYDWVSRLEVVTTNPDGVRKGQKGEAVLLITGGNYYVEINVDGNTIWRGVALTNTP
jgi:hypothetical protein